jgi:hypothetical protein
MAFLPMSLSYVLFAAWSVNAVKHILRMFGQIPEGDLVVPRVRTLAALEVSMLLVRHREGVLVELVADGGAVSSTHGEFLAVVAFARHPALACLNGETTTLSELMDTIAGYT